MSTVYRGAGFAAVLLLSGAISSPGAELQAGIARTRITPSSPIWMSGYAARNHPSEGVLAELWAKALALRDQGGTAVIVTTDLIGLPGAISADVMAGGKDRVARERLVLNSSHTHSGPVVGRNLSVMFDFSPPRPARVDAYAAKLTEDLVNVIGAALKDLAPARVAVGHGSAGFAINRREPTTQGVRIGVNPHGPVDHDVPVVEGHRARRPAAGRALRLRLPQHHARRRLLPD